MQDPQYSGFLVSDKILQHMDMGGVRIEDNGGWVGLGGGSRSVIYSCGFICQQCCQ